MTTIQLGDMVDDLALSHNGRGTVVNVLNDNWLSVHFGCGFRLMPVGYVTKAESEDLSPLEQAAAVITDYGLWALDPDEYEDCEQATVVRKLREAILR